MCAGAALTCLKQGGSIGGGLTVIGDGRDMDLVLLTAFEHGDLAAGGSRRTVEGCPGAVDGCGPVQIGAEHQIPSHCHHATGAAVLHGDCRDRVDSWRKRQNDDVVGRYSFNLTVRPH